MNKQEFEHFVKCYSSYRHRLASKGLSHQKIISYMYGHFGREFIHSLPVEYKLNQDGEELSVIRGTYWWHSTKHPLYIENGRPVFFILEQELTFDQWLPYSSLSSEEQLVFKLKYG